MRLEQLIPLPLRNIYDNCKALQSPICKKDREEKIKEITKDIFRILIAIPLASLAFVNNDKARMIASVICMVLLPESMAISLTGLLGYASIVLLVHGIATVNLGVVGVGSLCLAAGYLISENYKYVSKDGNSIEDALLNPISVRFAKAFV